MFMSSLWLTSALSLFPFLQILLVFVLHHYNTTESKSRSGKLLHTLQFWYYAFTAGTWYITLAFRLEPCYSLTICHGQHDSMVSQCIQLSSRSWRHSLEAKHGFDLYNKSSIFITTIPTWIRQAI
jgi:hypothetical protein